MTPNKLPPLPELPAHGITVLLAGNRVSGYTADQMHAYATEALRQSQSLPAVAVAGLVGKWRDHYADVSQWGEYNEASVRAFKTCADELEQALQADAREKGEAVAWRVETPYGVGYTFAEEMIAYMNDRDPDPAEPVAAKPAGEKVKMRNEDPRHGLYRVLQQRRNRLSPIDIARIENAIAALATQPAQASEKDNG